MQRFFQRVWREHVAPTLRDRQAGTRRKTARAGGMIAAATGGMLDGLFRLRGRPFTRSLTIVGTQLGAILPDAWDWNWWHELTDDAARETVRGAVAAQAESLPDADALALFDLTPAADHNALRQAWRAASQRWHPDKAPDDRQRQEYHLRFVAYQAAYERLHAAYEEGRLPIR